MSQRLVVFLFTAISAYPSRVAVSLPIICLPKVIRTPSTIKRLNCSMSKNSPQDDKKFLHDVQPILMENFSIPLSRIDSSESNDEKCKIESSPRILAKIINSDSESLKKAGKMILEGKLVAFPTETVYGLGGNAFNEEALRNIFHVKKRPSNDPLIVHVLDSTFALELVDYKENLELKELFIYLTNHFWPGPLTIVLPASKKVSDIVTASTGFVGIRSPSHKIARALIENSGVPICAPSANTFGHVSPTKAVHVFADLHESDITIIQDETSSCEIGIESTVIKLIPNINSVTQTDNEILILRNGKISAENLSRHVAGSSFSHWKVRVKDFSAAKDNDSENHEAPGQMLKHYSPNLEAFQISAKSHESKDDCGVISDLLVSKSIVIDFGAQNSNIKSKCLAYMDLSPIGSPDEAARILFESLRWAENHIGATSILMACIPDPVDGSLGAAYNDRIFRAASGKCIRLE